MNSQGEMSEREWSCPADAGSPSLPSQLMTEVAVLRRDDGADAPGAKISVIIVAFQSRGIIETAVDSVVGCGEVICVDNASSDRLDEALADRDIVYVRNDENVGYARACNQGAEIATGELILFMNPDVELAPGAIEAFSNAVRRYPDVDVFVPRTVRGDGRPWNRAVSNFEKSKGRYSQHLRQEAIGDCSVRFVDGGVFLIRRSAFLALGGFDENIFLYFEDDDLSLRLLAAGHQIVYVHDALATHRIGTSSRPISRYLVRKEFHKKRSEIYFNAKYGKPTNITSELIAGIAKILFYCITLRRRRALAAYGRFLGVLSLTRSQDNLSASPLSRARSDRSKT
jgi:N-acetylglucosaminyl-diphospho-decaprenol L-rhamnosyltransferase